MKTLGIYIHIPFCKSKCAYCDFYSLAGCDDRMMDAYLDALLIQFNDFFGAGGGYAADTVYIGGGTPSVFGGRRLQKMLTALEKKAPFARGCEITCEINPESCDKKLLRALVRAGVNRVSLGVQSGSDAELRSLGRLHDFEQARKAVQLCRDAGIGNVSVDLMFGLPGQSVQGWLDTLRCTLALAPDHVSAYALKLEPGTPMGDSPPALPDDDEQADMYLLGGELLREAGYKQYEISNFARNGLVSRHNMKYWDLQDYIGFGCGAHSYVDGKRFSFTRDIDGYLKTMLHKSGTIVDEMDDVAFTARTGEYVMLKLRTAAGIDENEFYRRFSIEFEPFSARLAPYIKSGHAVRDGGVYRLTPKGFLISNRILSDIIDAFESGGQAARAH